MKSEMSVGYFNRFPNKSQEKSMLDSGCWILDSPPKGSPQNSEMLDSPNKGSPQSSEMLDSGCLILEKSFTAEILLDKDIVLLINQKDYELIFFFWVKFKWVCSGVYGVWV